MQLDLLRRALNEHTPRVIFLNVDFFAFSSAYETRSRSKLGPQFDAKPWSDHLNTLHDSYLAWMKDPRLLFKPDHHTIYGPSLGLHPPIDSLGLIADGSETVLGRRVNIDRNKPPSFEEYESEPRARDYEGDKMGAEEMTEFEKIIHLARSRGVTVIGFQAPIYGPILSGLEAQSAQEGVLRDFEAHEAAGYFGRLDIIFFDFLRLPPYSDDYAYFIDPVHPSEVVDAVMLLKMAEDPRVRALLPRLDIPALQQKIDQDRSARQHLFLYKPDPLP